MAKVQKGHVNTCPFFSLCPLWFDFSFSFLCASSLHFSVTKIWHSRAQVLYSHIVTTYFQYLIIERSYLCLTQSVRHSLIIS